MDWSSLTHIIDDLLSLATLSLNLVAARAMCRSRTTRENPLKPSIPIGTEEPGQVVGQR